MHFRTVELTLKMSRSLSHYSALPTNRPNLPPTTITTKHTDNLPVGYGGRVHGFERGVCLEWVNVGGSGDESESLILNVGVKYSHQP